MSLQNPDNIVTEERLAEFYQQILPYMGGMPDVLANKFNRADLYSTDEKMIGRWIDGKPLYQKTISCGTVTADGSWHEVQHSISGIDQVVRADGALFGNNGAAVPVCSVVSSFNFTAYAEADKTKVNYVVGSSRSSGNYKLYVIIQYTKTTDSAVEIGSDTDYSTTEKIVGTWIDGKPLWQKTVEFGALPNNTLKEVSTGLSNVKIRKIEGITSKSGYAHSMPNAASPSATETIWYNYSNNKICVQTYENRSDYTETYFTLQYIKTSS